MDTVWPVLVIAGWVMNILVAAVLYLLVRQVGLLSRRLPEFGARDDHQGPGIGELAPPVEGRTIVDEPVLLTKGRKNLIVFVSTTCDVCVELLPSLRSLGRRFGGLNLIIVANDDPEPTRRFVDAHRLTSLQVVASRRLGGVFGVTYPPYAFAIDELGFVRARGLVNHAEHLRSLLNIFDEHPSPVDAEQTTHAIGVQGTSGHHEPTGERHANLR